MCICVLEREREFNMNTCLRPFFIFLYMHHTCMYHEYISDKGVQVGCYKLALHFVQFHINVIKMFINICCCYVVVFFILDFSWLIKITHKKLIFFHGKTAVVNFEATGIRNIEKISKIINFTELFYGIIFSVGVLFSSHISNDNSWPSFNISTA